MLLVRIVSLFRMIIPLLVMIISLFRMFIPLFRSLLGMFNALFARIIVSFLLRRLVLGSFSMLLRASFTTLLCLRFIVRLFR